MATHYICTGGCKGVAAEPGVCTAEGCSKQGQPLSQCNCADDLHTEMLENTTPSAEDDVTIING